MLEFGTTEEQFGAVAVACRRHANLNPDAVMHEKTMTIDDYLASPYARRPAAPVRLVPHLRRRRRVRDDERRAGARPAAAARRRRAASARGTRRTRRGTGASSATSRARRRCSPRRARSRWPGSRPPTSTCSPSTTRSPSCRSCRSRTWASARRARPGAFVEGDTLAPRRGQAAVQHPRRPALARVRARHRARRRGREAAARRPRPRRCPDCEVGGLRRLHRRAWRARSC